MGYIVLTFDDSYIEHRTLCAPYLSQKGITAGFAMIPGAHVGNNSGAGNLFMNVQMARDIQDVYKHECYTHAHTLPEHDDTGIATSADSYAALETTFTKAKRSMVSQGLCVNDTHEVFIAPPALPQYGDATNGAGTNSMISRHFICRRTFISGYSQASAGSPCETLPPMNVMHVRANGWNSSTVADVRAFISVIRQNPYAVGVMAFHRFITGGTGVHTTPANFTSIVDEIVFQRDNNYQSDLSAGTAAGKLRTATLSQLVRGQLAPTL